MRQIERVGDEERGRHPAVYCGVCQGATRHGKPYCSDHIEQMPYVQDLEARLAKMARDAQRYAEVGIRAVRLSSLLSREVIYHLEQGKSSVKIAQSLLVPEGAVAAIALRVVRASGSGVRKTRAGALILETT